MPPVRRARSGAGRGGTARVALGTGAVYSERSPDTVQNCTYCPRCWIQARPRAPSFSNFISFCGGFSARFQILLRWTVRLVHVSGSLLVVALADLLIPNLLRSVGTLDRRFSISCGCTVRVSRVFGPNPVVRIFFRLYAVPSAQTDSRAFAKGRGLASGVKPATSSRAARSRPRTTVWRRRSRRRCAKR